MRVRRPGRCYTFLRVVFRTVLSMTMRWRVEGLENEPSEGGYLLAICHLSHLDPVIVSSAMRRRISWVSRVEFYRHRLMRGFLRYNGAFPVDRSGYARPALREALARLADGEVVGIFPEGEIMSGADSVLRSGQVRQGICWLAARSACPVLPVVMLGTDRLGTVGPWLPAKRGRLWLTAGQSLTAPADAHTKAGRAAFAATLEAEFRRLFRETCQRHSLAESIVP